MDILAHLSQDGYEDHLYELRKAVNIFLQIKEARGSQKQDILLKHKDFQLFRAMLDFLYNPFVLTGMKKTKMIKFSNFVAGKEDKGIPLFDNIITVMEEIKKNNTGRDIDVKMVMNFINTIDPDIYSPVHDFLQEFFSKSFKCGITATTINKVYGKGTIPEFGVMLAKNYEEHQHKISGDFTITTKIDGIRCIAIKEGGKVKFYTRQGKKIEGLVELQKAYEDMLLDDYVYDGELILNDVTLPSDQLFRETQKVVSKKGEKYNLIHVIFDMLPVEEFYEGQSKKSYIERRKDLKTIYELQSIGRFNSVNTPSMNVIEVLPTLYVGNDKSMIKKLLKKVVAEDKEGIMVNMNDALYVTKRSDALLKVKEFHTIDLKIIGYEEGSGRLKGTLGAIIVDYKGHSVNVGSGLTEMDRNQLWKQRQSLVGRVAEIEYFEESTNKHGGTSLRFPTFVRLREEGKEVSYN